MTSIESEKSLAKLLENIDFQKSKNYKLIVLTGLLGDFDSFEYAIALSKYLKSKNCINNLDIYFVAIGNKSGAKKFCTFTGFPKNKIRVVNDNRLHNLIGAHKGLDTGLGGWINMLLMLCGIGSPKTIPEVLRGYFGDKNARQIYQGEDDINLFNLINFSGKLFENTFGNGYLRPMELATFRLSNMIEIIKNWNDYIINSKFLPQRSSTFLLDKEDNILFSYFSKNVLDYSNNMKFPLDFLSRIK